MACTRSAFLVGVIQLVGNETKIVGQGVAHGSPGHERGQGDETQDHGIVDCRAAVLVAKKFGYPNHDSALRFAQMSSCLERKYPQISEDCQRVSITILFNFLYYLTCQISDKITYYLLLILSCSNNAFEYSGT